MYLVKKKDGSFTPSDNNDYNEAKKVKVGEYVKCTRTRNVKHHKKAFALLNLWFENQDRFQEFEIARKVITIRAGYYDIAPTKDGEPYYIPKSLSFENMSQSDFEKWYEATLNIVAKDLEQSPDAIQAELAGFY